MKRKVGKGQGANPTLNKTKTWLSYSSIQAEVHESREGDTSWGLKGISNCSLYSVQFLQTTLKEIFMSIPLPVSLLWLKQLNKQINKNKIPFTSFPIPGARLRFQRQEVYPDSYRNFTGPQIASTEKIILCLC